MVEKLFGFLGALYLASEVMTAILFIIQKIDKARLIRLGLCLNKWSPPASLTGWVYSGIPNKPNLQFCYRRVVVGQNRE